MKKSEISGTDYSNLRLDPIPDLKVGDLLVRTIDGATNVPKVGDIIRVDSLDPVPDNREPGKTIIRNDFTWVCKLDNGHVIELDGDSRYYERVEE